MYPATALNMKIYTLADPSFNISSPQIYAQTVLVTVICIADYVNEKLYPKHGNSSKKQRFTHSSPGAGILATADGDDLGYYMKPAFDFLGTEWKLYHTLLV